MGVGASDLNAAVPEVPEEPEKFTHLVVLVHGWIGTEKDWGYFQETVERQTPDCSDIRVLNAKSNAGGTDDGIVNGGKRLADEIEEALSAIEQPVKLSIVAHSLGGLYARYAIAQLEFSNMLSPLIFCTSATPHLGVCNHTYIPIPRWAESRIGNFLKDTGRDLFCMTDIVKDMGTLPEYLDPLGKFETRIALANAFCTDFQVPASTAAFLSTSSEYKQTVVPSNDLYLLSVQTEPSQEYDKADMSQNLDSLGWTKVFLDVRDQIPVPSIPIPFTKPVVIPDKETWVSKDLVPIMNSAYGGRWQIPLGHSVAIANSRHNFYAWFNENGQPLMDQLAYDVLVLMGVTPKAPEIEPVTPQECVEFLSEVVSDPIAQEAEVDSKLADAASGEPQGYNKMADAKAPAADDARVTKMNTEVPVADAKIADSKASADSATEVPAEDVKIVDPTAEATDIKIVDPAAEASTTDIKIEDPEVPAADVKIVDPAADVPAEL